MMEELYSTGSRRLAARRIFDAALAAVEPAHAVRSAVREVDGQLLVAGQTIDRSKKIYGVAFGKAAFVMAQGLERALGSSLISGIAVGPEEASSEGAGKAQTDLSPKWRFLHGGHPLPDYASRHAGRAVIDFLRLMDATDAVIIFLISGGGSALMEWPIDPRISEDDTCDLYQLLLHSGAPIHEMNVVRRAFSSIKGGGLLRFASKAQKLGLIVSDTNTGDEAAVSSGPTFVPISPESSALEILRRYGWLDQLPPILREFAAAETVAEPRPQRPVHHQVLLDNGTALAAAAEEARRLGFRVELAPDICEQEIAAGCPLLVERFGSFSAREPICFLSGGEFGCRVHGKGIGGRNAETALRLVQLYAELDPRSRGLFTILCAGTDGIDGNSPAAGAIIDESSIDRADRAGLNAEEFLARSDSHTYFSKLTDVVMTGPTGTNVRDLRILLAVPSR
ncbi:MAG: DUF4147 domain-containing protein [Pyrinomonadaceae bacterium]